jgi:hypothetical protein
VAVAARAALGSHLLAIEIGNEPERFVEHGVRPAGDWGSRRYRHEVDVYRQAIEHAAPGVALAGPDAVSLQGSLGWVYREAAWQHPSLLTAHYYPLGACGGYRPTIGAVLSGGVRLAQSRMLQLADRVARRTTIPVRIDESNNAACGGQPGVSDRFAAALWATDYLGRAMASQVPGVNLHGLLSNPDGYAPIAYANAAARASGRLTANPEYYALLLTAHLVGDRPLHTAFTPFAGSVRAFRRPDGGLDVLAVNAGAAAQNLRLPKPPRFHHATIWRLTAPGPAARTGVRRAGAPTSGGKVVVAMPAYSAALVRLR